MRNGQRISYLAIAITVYNFKIDKDLLLCCQIMLGSVVLIYVYNNINKFGHLASKDNSRLFLLMSLYRTLVVQRKIYCVVPKQIK